MIPSKDPMWPQRKFSSQSQRCHLPSSSKVIPQVEDYIYLSAGHTPAGWVKAKAGEGETHQNGDPFCSAPGPVVHGHHLVPLPTAVICLEQPPVFVLSVRIKSGKMAGKVLAWGFSAKLIKVGNWT